MYSLPLSWCAAHQHDLTMRCAQADTLQSQLTQAQQEAGDAKSTADTSIAELQEALRDAVARQQEPAVRLSNPQACHRCRTQNPVGEWHAVWLSATDQAKIHMHRQVLPRSLDCL